MGNVSASRWLARKTLWESGVEPALLAAAAGMSLTALAKRAANEAWQGPNAGEDRPASVRLADLAGRLVGEVEAIELQGRDKALDKGRIEAVMALLKVVEKLGEMTPAQAGNDEDQKRSDADIAAVLAAVDAAILAHAEFLAKQGSDTEIRP